MAETKTKKAPATTTSKKPEVSDSKKKNTGMAILAYIIFFIPLLTDAKDDPFVKFHVKQGLVLLLLVVAGWFVGIIPVIGWIIALILPIVEIVLFIIGIINASKGEEKPLPLIGQFAEKINI